MSSKFLVTGGSGFIGSNLVRTLIEQGHSVVNVDKLTYAGDPQAFDAFQNHPNYSFAQVDIVDAKALKGVFEKHQPDRVMHLAAESHVDRSITGAADFIQTNIVGTYTLLEVAKDYWNSLKGLQKEAFRFHHISTDEVFGDLPHPDETSELPLFDEKTPYQPSSPYSASKASSDHLVRAWHRTYGLPVVISNCSNNYGPYQFPEKLIPKVIMNALQGLDIPVYGKGQQIRDWLYVQDHVDALIQVILQGKIGETYAIGGHNEVRNMDVVKQICAILEELSPSENNPNIDTYSCEPGNADSYLALIKSVSDRPGHDQRYAIDASKIQRELGWTPKESFASGLSKTVQWYLDNQDWCQRRIEEAS